MTESDSRVPPAVVGDKLFAPIVLFLIGDELLSGKRSDRHLPKVIELLKQRGMQLAGVEMLPDDERHIAAAIQRIHRTGGVLLSCGGIGATPDDCTRQAAARAFGRRLVLHAQAQTLIEARYGKQAHPNRVLMAEFPRGAQVIPNPVNQVPGFSVEHCYFVPGFPEMAWPMLEWVLDHRLRHLHQPDPPVEYTLRVSGARGEGDLLGLMQATLARYPGIKLSSLPSRGAEGRAPHIEFGLFGLQQMAAEAYRWFLEQLRQRPEVEIKILHGPN